jgi:lipid II isoglutaminyl synthase (glutamine-hydrolysing)
MNSKFFITHLYPNELALYGDIGNIIAVQKMLDEIGWEYEYQPVNIGDELPPKNDFIFVGGGQDQEQIRISSDLMRHKQSLKSLVDAGISVLAVCGGYQLFGRVLQLSGYELPTINIFPVTTTANQNNPKTRCIGNIILESMLPGVNASFVGFENHSGQTKFIENYFQPLGKVIYGQGNSFEAGFEGCIYNNAIGTYLHNFLPKNPEVVAWIINKSAELKYSKGEISLAKFQMVKELEINTSIGSNLLSRFAKNYKPNS